MLAEQSMSWGAAAALMIGVGALMVVAGWATIVITRRAPDGRTGPNRVAGIRTRATRASPEAWAAAHREGLPGTIRGARILMASGVISPIVGIAIAPDDAEAATGAWGIAILVGALLGSVILIRAARLANRVARDVAPAS